MSTSVPTAAEKRRRKGLRVAREWDGLMEPRLEDTEGSPPNEPGKRAVEPWVATAGLAERKGAVFFERIASTLVSMATQGSQIRSGCRGNGLSCCEAIIRVKARSEDGMWELEMVEGDVWVGTKEIGSIDEVTEEGE